MTLKRTLFTLCTLLAVGSLLSSCSQDPNDPGLEYAPNMYNSAGYEPLSQLEGDTNKINPYGINMREPAPKTIARRNYKTTYVSETGEEIDLGLMVYNTHRDSIEWAEKNLVNPLPLNKNTIAEGKALYERFCASCHGVDGKGQGKVGVVYQGVANLAGGQIAKYNGGHIFHVITHGKGRMWPHASQMNALERWKIVQYVHVLQGQIDEEGKSPNAEGEGEKTEDKKEEKKEEAKAPETVATAKADNK